MKVQVDGQTKRIIEYLRQKHPSYWRQAQWSASCFLRCIDCLLLGAISRFLLESGRKATGSKAISLLTKAIGIASSKATMGKAFYYRGNYLFEGVIDADNSIADYSMAIWCDPSDCWARKDRATIFEMYYHGYKNGDEYNQLPMTLSDTIADTEAAITFFQALIKEHPSLQMREQAKKILGQCLELREKLKAHELK